MLAVVLVRISSESVIMAQSSGSSGTVSRHTLVISCKRGTYHDDLVKFYNNQKRLNQAVGVAFRSQQELVANLVTRTLSLESAMAEQKKLNASAAQILQHIQAEIRSGKHRNEEDSSDEEYSDEDRKTVCKDCKKKLRQDPRRPFPTDAVSIIGNQFSFLNLSLKP